ncbi:collagen alpha-4(VI) chain-like [Dreissena polymorpha]|uniref:collagen alpha-4(VI) chain-like n=1 Tax=Dreissena polymorpha TaxID=45954 RepID=UPI0022650ACC|nr:collagen alpha-4(VI) chain-like [Dreissena polymorpha]
MNEGKCHLQNGGKEFNCTCADGYLGDNCQIDMCSPYKIADIVFIMDVSVSQNETTFVEQKNFVKYFIAQFPLGPDHFQFSLILYASEPHAVFNLSNMYDNYTIIDAVDNATIPDDKRGATFTGKALAFVKDNSFATTNGGRADVDRYVILLTDGMSSASLDTANQAKLLRLSYPNVRIKSIGSGDIVFHTELLEISTYPLNVFPLHGNDSVRSVQKSTMYGCERCTTAYSDVVLAFDVSSFNYGQLDTMLKTAEVLIANLHTDVNQTRVGLSKYESIAEEVFEFDEYTTSNEMISVMNKHIMKSETCMKDKQCSSRDISSLLQDVLREFQKNSEKSRRKAVVIFSQFIFDKDIAGRVVLEIQNLKDNGVSVIVVGEGLEANIDKMLKLSTTSFFTFIIGEDFNTPIDAILALMSTLEYNICFVQ